MTAAELVGDTANRGTVIPRGAAEAKSRLLVPVRESVDRRKWLSMRFEIIWISWQAADIPYCKGNHMPDCVNGQG